MITKGCILLEKEDRNKKQSFWTTLPGILTGSAALLTALGGLIIALSSSGILKPSTSSPPLVPPPITQMPPSITPIPPSATPETVDEPTGNRGVVVELLSDRSYGSPIAGAMIVYESEDGLARVETTSGENGSYQIELQAGRYKVSVIHPDYLTYSTGSGFSVIPGPGYQTANYFLTVKEGLRCPPEGKFPSKASVDWRNQIDTPPEVQIFVNPRTVKIGEAFTVTVEGVDDANLSAVWWSGESTGDDDLDKAHWFDCGGQTTCSNSWAATATVGGTLLLSANGRDLAYPTPGEAHQASEGSGLSCTTIEVSEK